MVNLPDLEELVVVINEKVAEASEGCSISYQLMNNTSPLKAKRSFCQLESGANIYTNFVFVRPKDNKTFEPFKLSLDNRQHVNFTITGT